MGTKRLHTNEEDGNANFVRYLDTRFPVFLDGLHHDDWVEQTVIAL